VPSGFAGGATLSFGPVEILVVLFIVAMIVGPSRITRMARSLGRGAYDFIDELGSKGKDRDEEKVGSSGELEPGKNGREHGRE
jgi:sec-independent protein translocase protein TatA